MNKKKIPTTDRCQKKISGKIMKLPDKVFLNKLNFFVTVQQMLNKLVCIEHNECGACLSAASHCRWCADINYNSGAPRCNDDERYLRKRIIIVSVMSMGLSTKMMNL